MTYKVFVPQEQVSNEPNNLQTICRRRIDLFRFIQIRMNGAGPKIATVAETGAVVSLSY